MKVLSLCGGGFMSYYTALILQHLEAASNGGKTPSTGLLHKHFNLVCGTSMGGLLALAVAHKLPMFTVANAMKAHGPRIFPTRPFLKRQVARFKQVFVGTKYETEALRKAVQQILPPSKMKLNDVAIPVLIPAINLSNGRPEIFRGYPAEIENKYGAFGSELPSFDVGMATSAAPTYFSPHTIGIQQFADGGLVANAPDLLGVQEVKKLFRASESPSILSIGVPTTDTRRYKAQNPKSFRDWVKGNLIFRVTISGQMHQSRDIARSIIGEPNHTIIEDSPPPDSAIDLELDNASREAIDVIEKMVELKVNQPEFRAICNRWITS